MPRDLFEGRIDVPGDDDEEGLRITIYGPRDQARVRRARKQGVQIIDTTSHSSTWGRNLSPFLLGPVRLYDDHKARNVENAWQFAKLYPQHADEDGLPTEAYWEWARSGWSKWRAIRYPMGKGAVPLGSVWDGEVLDYIAARKRIYLPLYAGCVRATHAWTKLLEMARRGEHIHLWDFDGYDYRGEGISIVRALEDPDRKFGHSMVLAYMLEQEVGV